MQDDGRHYTITSDGDTVTLVGDIDLAAAPDFRSHLHATIERCAPGGVFVDAYGVDFIDSTALGVLVAGSRRLASVGAERADILIVGASERITKVFEVTALAKLFAFVDERPA